MAMSNPRGRVNYEPNSWGAAQGGPREDPQGGFTSFAAEPDGAKLRVRPESFADHYSQARQFFVSQDAIEQKHIADALVFELSKVERPDIRTRIVSHLLIIDEGLARKVADGLALPALPAPAQAARPTIQDLPPSAALSIVKNGPPTFKGRKLGILLSDGADAALFKGLTGAIDKVGAVWEVVAPKIGGVTLSDGTKVAAKQKIDGGPSVLFDAIAVVVSTAGATALASDAPTQDFVRDAFGHCKFIGLTREAQPIFDKAGLADALDEACIVLSSAKDCAVYVDTIAALRFWPRELKVDADAK